MSSEPAYLALMLDAPMQSWGFSSRFQRRTTGLHPTKSGIIGMICAAMGLDKHSVGSDLACEPSQDTATTQGRALHETEKTMLPKLAKLSITTIVIPRKIKDRWSDKEKVLDVLRMEDFHTVLGTRAASGGIKKDAVISRRQYLLDAKFGVILQGDKALLERIAGALKNPVWGIWFGRKNCIPAAPVFRGPFPSKEEAEANLLEGAPIGQFTRIEESDFNDGNDTWSDGVPESYAGMRPWPVRRINQKPCENAQNV